MNNCPKCGNPLQSGDTSCPICGTLVSAAKPAEVKKENVESKPVVQAKPVAPVRAKPVAPGSVQAKPVAPAQAKPVAPGSAQAKPVAPAQAKPVAPVTNSAKPVSAAPAQVKPAPAAAPASTTVSAPPVPKTVQTATVKPVAPGTLPTKPAPGSVQAKPIAPVQAKPAAPGTVQAKPVQTNVAPSKGIVDDGAVQKTFKAENAQVSAIKPTTVVPKPVAQAQAKPAAPAQAKPVAPAQAKPVAPGTVQAKPVAPVQAKPVAPGSVASRPVPTVNKQVIKPLIDPTKGENVAPQAEKKVAVSTIKPFQEEVVEEKKEVKVVAPKVEKTFEADISPFPTAQENKSDSEEVVSVKPSFSSDGFSSADSETFAKKEESVVKEEVKEEIKEEKQEEFKKEENLNSLKIESKPIETKEKAKFGFDPMLIIAGVLAVAIIVTLVFLMVSGDKEKTLTNEEPKNDIIAQNTKSNGYKFNINSDWYVIEDGENVIINNKAESVAMRLENANTSMSSFSVSALESVYTNDSFTNVKVSSGKLDNKDYYVVDVLYSGLNVQYYFVYNTSESIVGASVIYQSSDAKNRYEADVKKVLETLSYDDDSLKALDSMSMYSDVFNAFNDAVE